MFNPFKTQVPVTSYAPQPSEIRPDTNSTVHANVVYLDDATYPDNPGVTPNTGNLGDTINPAVDATWTQGDESLTVVHDPNVLPAYAFLDNDLNTPVDVGSVPGTTTGVIHNGPVTGQILDNFQEGNITITASTPPGYYGPVGNTEPGYATLVAYANYQQLQSDQSNDVATYQQIAAI